LNLNGLIDKQDNWVDQPGQGYAAIRLDTSPANGTKVAWHVPTVGFNQSAYLTRVNDGSFSFPAISPLQIRLTIQFDCTGEHVAMFALGHDRNNDGMLLKSDGEIGPSFGTWDQSFRIQGANLGTAHDAPFGSGNARYDWYRIQLRIDFTGYGSNGSGSLFYKNLTDGDPQFTAVPALQGIDLELSSLHPDAGPTTWDSMWIELLSGGGNHPSADNLVPVEDATICQLYLTGNPVPGENITFNVVGIPGTDPVKLYRGSLRNTPLSTKYGLLFIKKPFPHIWNIGPVPADGIAFTSKKIPGSVPPGYEFYFQALHGPANDPSTILTNLLVLEVE
jgi:hypothetical protein